MPERTFGMDCAKISSFRPNTLPGGTAMRWKIGLVLAMALGSAPVRAQDIKDVLSNLPEETMAFAVTNRLEQMDDRMQGLLKKMQLNLPISPMEMVKAQL